ncbi:hypothetical protein BH11VER1_BH11VER1_21210 [soil metagenome]
MPTGFSLTKELAFSGSAPKVMPRFIPAFNFTFAAGIKGKTNNAAPAAFQRQNYNPIKHL